MLWLFFLYTSTQLEEFYIGLLVIRAIFSDGQPVADNSPAATANQL